MDRFKGLVGIKASINVKRNFFFVRRYADQ